MTPSAGTRILGVVLNRATGDAWRLLPRLLRLLRHTRSPGAPDSDDAVPAVRVTVRSMTLVAFETVLIVSAIAPGRVRAPGAPGRGTSSSGTTASPRLAIVAVGPADAASTYADLYDLRVLSDRRELFIRIVQALASASFVLAGALFLVSVADHRPRRLRDRALLVIALVIGWRLAFEWLSRRVGPRERLLLVGTSAAAVDAGARDVRAPARARRRDRRVRRSRSRARRRRRSSIRASSARSRTSPRSSAPAASIASSSAWPTRAASCRWTSCSR